MNGYTRKRRRNEWNASIRRRVENVRKVRQSKLQIPKLTTQPTHAHKNKKKSKIKTGKGQQRKTTTQSNVWAWKMEWGEEGNYTLCFLSAYTCVCVGVCHTHSLSNHSGTSIVYWSRDSNTAETEAESVRATLGGQANAQAHKRRRERVHTHT